MRTKLQLGDIVLIGDDQKKCMDWPLARVVEMFLGNEKRIRLVKVRGQLLRPVQHLYHLESVDTSVEFTSQEVIGHLRGVTKINQLVSGKYLKIKAEYP